MKIILILSLLSVTLPALAADSIELKFTKNIFLGRNEDSEARWVYSRFDKVDSFQISEPDGKALRGCIVSAWTEPNNAGVIWSGRKLTLKKAEGAQEPNLPKYRLQDEGGVTKAYVQCFKRDDDEPNILSKMRQYLGAETMDSGRMSPISFQPQSRAQRQEERAQLLQPLLKEEVKTAEEAVEL